ncbi:MAG: DUF262 domain-containing HNH endonuclease family protein [Pseudomonadota bacterium]
MAAPLPSDIATYLQADVMTLDGLFARGQPFVLSWSQRSYAWREDNMRRLCTDLAAKFFGEPNCHALGYISVAEPEPGGPFGLVDGQQRLISLSLIFGHLISELGPGATSDRLRGCLLHDGEPLLQVQDHLAALFDTLVLQPARGAPVADVDTTGLNWSEIGLLLNQQVIGPTLADCEITGPRLDEFATFLLTRCLIVLERVQSEREALQMLTTEEETGLPFVSAERAKVTLMSLLADDEREAASDTWDHYQSLLGSDALHQMLDSLRIQAIGSAWTGRGASPVETDLAQLFRVGEADTQFMDDEFVPGARSFAALLQCETAEEAATVTGADWPSAVIDGVRTLRWLDKPYWIAPALAWMRQHGPDHTATQDFLAALDRLAWLDRLGSTSPERSAKTFAGLASDIKKTPLLVELQRLTPTDKIEKQARENLDSRTFFYKPWSHLVLRRLGLILGADPGPKDTDRVTGEHVLPRSPDDPSQWWRDFVDAGEAVDQWSDRIGNMVQISRSDNQACGNDDWIVKRPILAASGMALAMDAARATTWTPADIRERSDRMITLFLDDLGRPPAR